MNWLQHTQLHAGCTDCTGCTVAIDMQSKYGRETGGNSAHLQKQEAEGLKQWRRNRMGERLSEASDD